MSPHRLRRLRRTAALRSLVADVTLAPNNLILPIFVKEGLGAPRDIPGMMGVHQHTEHTFLTVLEDAIDAGICAVMLFAVPTTHDATGSDAANPDGILSRVVAAARQHVGDQLVIIADLCLDEFTEHGHCGVLNNRGEVDNDATLAHYAVFAQNLAAAGADLLGTSGMMDGQVRAVRHALDAHGYTTTGILAYAAKFASNFYAPFRNAVESQLTGDRNGYQQDYRRSRESLAEIHADLTEGADLIMVKPALAYLDVVAQAAAISDAPVATYIVSGEYAMIEAAAAAGVVNRDATILEALYACRRAGAHLICTYWALEVARNLKGAS